MKYGQQRLVAGRKNYIFFLCPLDGEQFISDFLLSGAAGGRRAFNFLVVYQFDKLEVVFILPEKGSVQRSNNEPVPLCVLPSFSVYVETKRGSRFVQ